MRHYRTTPGTLNSFCTALSCGVFIAGCGSHCTTGHHRPAGTTYSGTVGTTATSSDLAGHCWLVASLAIAVAPGRLAHANDYLPASPSTSLPDIMVRSLVTCPVSALLSAPRCCLLGISPVAPNTGPPPHGQDRPWRSARTTPPTVGSRQATPLMAHLDPVEYEPTLREPASMSSAVLAH